jgi:hypothetical protein
MEHAEYNPEGAREYENQYLADMEKSKTEKEIKQKYKNKKDAASKVFGASEKLFSSGKPREILDTQKKLTMEKIEMDEKEALANPEAYKQKEAYSNSPEGKLEKKINDLKYKQERLEIDQQQMKFDQDIKEIRNK